MDKRWLIAASAVGIHGSIGSVYAWSVLNGPLLKAFGLGGGDLWRITLTFTLAIFFLGLSAAFLGRTVEKYGARRSGVVSAFLFAAGLVGTGLAVRYGALWLLYLSYGVIGGMGLGIGYITPVSTLIQWFPQRRGLATGIAIMGFGFASFLACFLINRLLAVVSLETMFYILGGFYFTVIFCSSLMIVPPPGAVGTAAPAGNGSIDRHGSLIQLTAGQALRTRRFYYLWFIFFVNIACGIAIISVAKEMGSKLALMEPAAASLMVALMGLFNGLGRIGWSTLSDYMGRPVLWVSFMTIQIAIFFSIGHLAPSHTLLFQVLIFLVISCYGGAFASAPAYISDLFGTRQVSAILGLILTAWSAAGIAGPMVFSLIYKRSGSFQPALNLCGALFVLSLVVAVLLVRDLQRLRRGLPQPVVVV